MTLEKEVVRIGPFKDYIASGVRIGELITLSGQISMNNEGDIIGAGDITAQLRQAYANVEEVLAEFGATMDNVIDEMWLATDIDDVMANAEEMLRIRAEAYGGTPDVTQTLVQISRLIYPELLVEVKCIARM